MVTIIVLSIGAPGIPGVSLVCLSALLVQIVVARSEGLIDTEKFKQK